MTTVLIYLNLFGSFVGKQLALIKKRYISLLVCVPMLQPCRRPAHLVIIRTHSELVSDPVSLVCERVRGIS